MSGQRQSYVSEDFDWDANGTAGEAPDDDITKDTGVFWPEYADDPRTRNASATVGKIYDGTGNTLMFGENLNAGNGNWSNPSFNSCGFMLPVTGGAATAGSTTTASNVSIGSTSTALLAGTTPYINDRKNGPEGAPFLNSAHPSLVVVSMCDGSARTLQEDMDRNVYAALITPSGTRLRTLGGSPPPQWLAEEPVSGDQF